MVYVHFIIVVVVVVKWNREWHIWSIATAECRKNTVRRSISHFTLNHKTWRKEQKLCFKVLWLSKSFNRKTNSLTNCSHRKTFKKRVFKYEINIPFLKYSCIFNESFVIRYRLGWHVHHHWMTSSTVLCNNSIRRQ